MVVSLPPLMKLTDAARQPAATKYSRALLQWFVVIIWCSPNSILALFVIFVNIFLTAQSKSRKPVKAVQQQHCRRTIAWPLK